MEKLGKGLLEVDPKKSTILLALAVKGSLTAKLLTEVLGISMSSAYHHLQELEKKEILKRYGRIGRSVFYLPTSEGRKLAIGLAKAILDELHTGVGISWKSVEWVEVEAPKNVREVLKQMGVLQANPLWKHYEDAKKEGSDLYVTYNQRTGVIVKWTTAKSPPGEYWHIHVPKKWIIPREFLAALEDVEEHMKVEVH